MYIKYVRICGFKSYREKIECGPLSPMHNSVVGLNGSGKSNFFAALRFVLSDAYTNMRPEERAKLLNEGAGASLVSAYVEIVFDNSDHRLDSEKDEVVIRRQIGLKKDEYFVDNKHSTKQDISNMLETAGFSKSNPYYIVEQGKVTRITTMKDRERLELLKEVAGTNVYEEKKEETLKIMRDSNKRMEEIKKNLDIIEDKLAKLDAEKEELSQYYQLDKERRSLQLALLHQKKNGLHEELTNIGREMNEKKAESTDGDKDMRDVEQEKERLAQQLNGLEKLCERLENERLGLEVEENDKIQEKCDEEAQVKRMQRKIKSEEQEYNAKKAQVSSLKKEIEKTQSKIASSQPGLQTQSQEIEDLDENFHRVNRELETLQSIQGNANTYTSKAQRDQHLQGELRNVQAELDSRLADEASTNKQIEAAKKEIARMEAAIEQSKDAKTNHKEEMKQKQDKLRQLEDQSVDLVKQVKDCERKLSEIQTTKDASEYAVQKHREAMQQNMPGAAARAIRFLNKYVNEHKIKGYHGPVINLFECNKRFNTAVEQAGGARLFNCVVDDDNVASRLVEALQKSKEGRMQFLPLSRLQPDVPQFPQDAANAKPLHTCLSYDAKFEPAILEVFGKTLLCESLEAASGYRASHGLACVTMDGDKLARKGAIKGGYYDASQSKITLNKDIQAEEEKIRKTAAEEEKLTTKKRQLEQTNTQVLSDSSKLRGEMVVSKENEGKSARSADLDRKQLGREKELLREKEQKQRSDRSYIVELQHKVEGLQDQLNQAFSQNLTQQQEADLKRLTTESNKLGKVRADKHNALAKAERDRTLLEETVQTQQQDLESLLAELENAQGRGGEELQMGERRLQVLKAEADEASGRRVAKEQELAKAKDDKAECGAALQKQTNEIKRQQKKFADSRKALDHLQDRKNRLHTELDHTQAQQRELGSHPEQFEKYKDKNNKKLHDELHKVTEKLKAFKDVNKKALDQFNQFTEQREKFKERKEELEQGAAKIEDLITKLDHKKDEAIQTTFRMVAKNFSDVFKKIVPGGAGDLIMRTSDKEADDDEDAEPGEAASAIRRYVGVSVKVRFQAGGEVRVMNSLSGGQKTVVALAIIFAIQKCDPAPFYLFDEVDANLDPMYRLAVATEITSQKQGDGENTVQFITSSFQPELVNAADCHWITNHHGMSRIKLGTKEDSVSVLREAQKQITNVGK
uniref:Structural maintenance of chromosomes protein n=2 Tax=Hemiselmis andersenii TaxID=464988 RepID=A0A6U4NQC6_HEMAN|mmetsp:Transcript_61067/g.146923  ORF Transcript_61067/g.146923 Transcript_61067/m.146923 type:complete len:1203 (+) Transcript_61067:36-3644(+)